MAGRPRRGDSGIDVWSPYPTGDFTAESIVDRADLDLVMSSWGVPFDELPDSWQSNPPGAIVDQAELDAVLRKWGSVGDFLPPLLRAVPEPSGVVLLLTVVLAAVAARRPLSRSARYERPHIPSVSPPLHV